MDTRTGREEEILVEFRKNVQGLFSVEPKDQYLLKWLRARKFDLKKAEQMLRKSLKWREEVDADHMIDNYTVPSVIEAYYPGGVHGTDKDGRPIVIYPLGRLDIKGLMRSARKHDIIKAMALSNEKLIKLMSPLSLQNGRPIDQCVAILDFEEFGTKHLWRPAAQLYLDLLAMLEENYPEMLYKSYIINGPKAFYVGYKLLKPFVNEETLKKFTIFGTDWKERLHEDIDPAQLPLQWGGTCHCDTKQDCQYKICMGGDIPKTLYLKEQLLTHQENFTHTVVKRRTSLHLEYDITDENSVIRWEFYTKENPIGFGIFRKTEDGNQGIKQMETMEPIKKYNCHLIPEDGMYMSECAGTYVLYFDNTGAKLQNKHLSYMVEVLSRRNNYLNDEDVVTRETARADDTSNESTIA